MAGVREVVVGVDVGGTKIAGGFVAADGTVSELRSVATPRGPTGADPGAVATERLIRELFAAAESTANDVVGVGIGVPEYVTPGGEPTSAEVLGWNTGDVDRLRQLGTTFESDVRCGALAEHRFGHGRQLASFLFVTIGTGIAHALVIGESVWAGHRGEALALGELPIDPTDVVRPGVRLTLEQQASGLAIELAGGGGEVLGRAGRAIGRALAVAVRLLDPAAIIIGGGLGTGSDVLRATLESAYRDAAARPDPPPVLTSALGATGGVIGAGLVSLDRGDRGGSRR